MNGRVCCITTNIIYCPVWLSHLLFWVSLYKQCSLQYKSVLHHMHDLMETSLDFTYPRCPLFCWKHSFVWVSFRLISSHDIRLNRIDCNFYSRKLKILLEKLPSWSPLFFIQKTNRLIKNNDSENVFFQKSLRQRDNIVSITVGREQT